MGSNTVLKPINIDPNLIHELRNKFIVEVDPHLQIEVEVKNGWIVFGGSPKTTPPGAVLGISPVAGEDVTFEYTITVTAPDRGDLVAITRVNCARVGGPFHDIASPDPIPAANEYLGYEEFVIPGPGKYGFSKFDLPMQLDRCTHLILNVVHGPFAEIPASKGSLTLSMCCYPKPIVR